MVPRIALLSTSDTDLLSARGAAPTMSWPIRRDRRMRSSARCSREDLIVARILGSAQLLCSGSRAVP